MPLTIHTWPAAIKFRLIDLMNDAQTRSGGQSVSGREQVVVSGADKWRCKIELPTLRAEYVKPYRAFLARVRGRGNAFALPIADNHFWPSDAKLGLSAPQNRNGIPFAGGAFFSDGTGFAADDIYAEGIVSNAAIGAVQITVDLSTWGEILEIGQYFGLDDWAHIVTGIVYDSAGVATIDFMPPLRRAVVSTTQFRFRPVLVCRFEKDDSGRHPLDIGRFTSPRLDVVEVLER